MTDVKNTRMRPEGKGMAAAESGEPIKIPVVAYEEISEEAFVKRAREMTPATDPRHSLFSIVYIESFAGQKIPCVVVGISPRAGGWTYELVRPDGVASKKKETVSEREIK